MAKTFNLTAFFLLLACQVIAQNQFKPLSGSVTSLRKEPLANIKVTILENAVVIKSVYTDSLGEFNCILELLLQNEYAIKTLSDYGIMIYGTFIIGYDFDEIDTFSTIYDFAMKNNLMLANFNPLIPMPGTKLYNRFNLEGRLIYEKWWLDSRYRYGDTVYNPKGMSPEELAEGCFKTRSDFNKYSSIMKRLIKSKSNHKNIFNSVIFLASNLISKKEIANKQGVMLGDKSLSLDYGGD